MLQCPVRDCQMALVREGRRLVCPRNHSFDVARSGYINLLQPQERRSKQPGDTLAAVAARRRLHDRGFTAPLLAGIAELAHATASARMTLSRVFRRRREPRGSRRTDRGVRGDRG